MKNEMKNEMKNSFFGIACAGARNVNQNRMRLNLRKFSRTTAEPQTHSEGCLPQNARTGQLSHPVEPAQTYKISMRAFTSSILIRF